MEEPEERRLATDYFEILCDAASITLRLARRGVACLLFARECSATPANTISLCAAGLVANPVARVYRQPMGHYCWLCGRMRPNESFSGRGRRVHECQRCRRSIPPARRALLRLSSDLERMLRQSRISIRNVRWAESLATHEDEVVRNVASIVAEIGRVHPHRRRRHAAIRRAHAQLWERMVAAGLVEDWFTADSDNLAWDERSLEFDEPWPEPEAAWIEAPDEDDDGDAPLPF